jgi:hypothetical protein
MPRSGKESNDEPCKKTRSAVFLMLVVLARTKFEASVWWACGGFIWSPMPSRGDDGIELKFVRSLQWVSTSHRK